MKLLQATDYLEMIYWIAHQIMIIYNFICTMQLNIDFLKSAFRALYTPFRFKRYYLFHNLLLIKSSENQFYFLPAFYLIICLMKASKNFEKIAILKI